VLRRAGAVLADSDQNIATRRAATNTDPDIATRHALGGHGAMSTARCPRCGSRPATNAEPRPGRGAVTPGQLGKPNNDTRLPPRMVVQTNKACPEARLFPVTRCMLFNSEGPVNDSAGVRAEHTCPLRQLRRLNIATLTVSTGQTGPAWARKSHFSPFSPLGV